MDRVHYILNFRGSPLDERNWFQSAWRAGHIAPGERYTHRWTVVQPCRPELTLRGPDWLFALRVMVGGQEQLAAPLHAWELPHRTFAELLAGETIVIEVGSGLQKEG